MAKSGFYEELKRRKVFRAAALYAGGAWFTASALDILLPIAGAPDWVMPTLLVILALGLPLALLAAWFLELSSTGIQADSGEGQSPQALWPLTLTVALLAAGAISLTYYFDQALSPTELNEDAEVVVLTMRDLSPTSDMAWFAEGLSMEVRRQMSAWNTFAVTPLASTPRTAQEALKLNVDLMLDGFVQANAEQVTIYVELLDIKRAEIIWQNEFKGSANNPLALQQQIAAEIARVFNQSLGANSLDGPSNPTAYAAYLKRLHHANTGDREEDIYWLTKAVSLDPDWLEGKAELAQLHLQRFGHSQDIRHLHKSKTVLALARQASNHYPVSAMVTLFGDGMLDEGEQLFSSMVQVPTNPRTVYLYAWLMEVSGLYAEAEAALRHVSEQEPYFQPAWEHLLWTRANQGNYASAAEAAAKLQQYSPSSLGYGNRYASITVWPFTKSYAEAASAIGQFEKYAEIHRDPTPSRDFVRSVLDIAKFNLAMSSKDNTAGTVVALSRIANNRPAEAALMYLRMGDEARAKELFEQAANTARYALWGWMYRTQMLTPELRKHPLFVQHEANMGITQKWRHELCLRASKMPPATGISCDPENYEPNRGN